MFTKAPYKKIGILGGMGPEATAELYLRIIRIFQKEFGAKYDADFPEMVLLNLPLSDVVENFQENSEVEKKLVEGVKKLEAAGVDFIAIPCNTVNFYFASLQRAVSIPLLNILQEVAKEVRQQNLKKVALLATEMTFSKKLYQSVLTDVKVITPNNRDRKEITRIILTILRGKKSAQDRKKLRRLIKKLSLCGAEKVILGCTELPLLIKRNNFVIDTIEVLAKAIVRQSTIRKSTNTKKPSGLKTGKTKK